VAQPFDPAARPAPRVLCRTHRSWPADDPTRRADLIKLLDTVPAGEAGSVGTDADWLRAALGPW
jgi:hypothetical protein